MFRQVSYSDISTCLFFHHYIDMAHCSYVIILVYAMVILAMSVPTILTVLSLTEVHYDVLMGKRLQVLFFVCKCIIFVLNSFTLHIPLSRQCQGGLNFNCSNDSSVCASSSSLECDGS